MNPIPFLILLFLAPTYSYNQDFNRHKVDKLMTGLNLEQWSGNHKSWGNQYILILKAKKSTFRLDLAFARDTLIKTSSFAKATSAIAAINGGFFDMKAGNSVSFLYIDGREINENRAHLLSEENEISANALIIYENGGSEIAPTEGVRKTPALSKVEDALVSGPLLIKNNQINELLKRPFNDLKHPRSVICLTKKEIWMVAVDGRHSEAVGMNLNELSQFLLSCGCPNALNLDGGGSTTLFLQTPKIKGIINHPSDNKKFDSEGERPVANIVYLKKKNQAG
jgi:exopolysaccharide biosynthesis protein